ncbi:hypothetical protein GW813_06740 [bacterium]|nr:hypothetical protein [bacterium]
MEDFAPYPPPFRLDGRLVQPDLNRIDGPEGPVRMEPRIMQVLLVLVQQPGKVIPREVILERVWSDQIVGEENLTRAISELRRIFGDDPRRSRVIETIRNHGYRIIADIEPVADPSAGEAERDAPPEMPGGGEPASRTSRGPGRGKWLIPAVAVMLAVVLFWRVRSPQAPEQGGREFWSGPAVPLTSFPGGERHPALSPDGRRVAFVWVGADMPPGCISALSIKQRDAEASLRLTGESGWCAWPVWSPDGQMLAYVQGGEDGIALCSVAALGGAVRILYRSRDLIEGVDWSPDGATLVFSAREEESGTHKLMSLDYQAMTIAELQVSREIEGEDLQPRFDPVGADLAWIHRDPGGGFSLRRGKPDGRSSVELASGLGPLSGLAWLPDGGHLVFGAAGGPARLWTVASEGQDLRPLDTGPEYAMTPSVARLTGDLAFAQVRMDRDLVRIQVVSRDPWKLETRSLAPSTRGELTGEFSPDGTRIALVSARSGHPEIWLAGADGSDLMRLTDLQGAAVSRLRWSPAGDRIAFQVAGQGQDSVLTISTAGGRPRSVPLPGPRAALSGWMPGGEALIVAVRTGSDWRLQRIPLSAENHHGSKAVSLLTLPATSGAIGGGGHILYFTRPEQPGLWKTHLPEGDPELVIPDLSLLDQGHWRLVGDHVAWVQRIAGRPFLVWKNMEGGGESIVADLPGLGVGGLAVAPGGAAILYPRERIAAADIMFMAASDKKNQ